MVVVVVVVLLLLLLLLGRLRLWRRRQRCRGVNLGGGETALGLRCLYMPPLMKGTWARGGS